MTRVRIIIFVLVGLVGLVDLGLGPLRSAEAATIAVPADQPSVAAALAAAGAGDSIVLSPGVYHESGLRIPVGVTLRGAGATASETVLDAGGLGRILLVESVTDSTFIQNLTFRNALALGKNSYEQSGGAVFISRSSVRIDNCVFTDNTAEAHGGAIRVSASSPTIEGCTFRGNEAPNGGGGAIEASFGSSPMIVGCLFETNAAQWGGAVSVRVGGTVTVQNSKLVGNLALGSLGYGGAIFADKNSVVGVINTVMSSNQARFGGAVACFANSMVNLAHVTVTDNRSAVLGGGMLIIDASPYISNSIFAFNDGTGIGVAGTSAPVITCSGMYGNTRGDWTNSLTAITDMEVNSSADPLFCSRDPFAEDGLHLQQGSPLLEDMSGCAVPGAFEHPCGATVARELPPVQPRIDMVLASPNPFNPRTNITFSMSQPQDVRIAVYGLRGELIRTLVNGQLAGGDHVLSWEGLDQAGRAVGSGVYFVVVRGEQDSHTLKLTLLK
jgi:predicted outer membrane repeat protein